MKAEYTKLLRDFLGQVQYELPRHRYDLALESLVHEYFLPVRTLLPTWALTVPKEAQRWPFYLRLKSGIAEAYAWMAFPPALYPENTHFRVYLLAVPELTYVFNAVNEIFSFHKECIVGTERSNFVSNVAIANSVSPLRALELLCDETIQAMRRVRSILSVKPGMKQDIEPLFHGYILYHLSQTRYRLAELHIPEAREACNLMKGTLFQDHTPSGHIEKRATGNGQAW
ncbi:terpenoid synthase [Aspergillus ibericus CBS 121593]|uniref:Terpenoid synthase n=1 Tax=Aspergillus ibericus CBS 121593 TaxID=1448316 RepID=A0A395H2Z6_9EURO|nr:terpenoid synthase [Aspergillus ibericus CBS 121593]RAL01218.1 terpenoid synthase [Aspergillus ibericus CBS 121593]